MGLVVTTAILVLIAALVLALPTWPYSRGWGYMPGTVIGFPLMVLLMLWLLGVV